MSPPESTPTDLRRASSRARRPARFGADARQSRRRLVTYLLLAGAVVLMVDALVGDNGYLARLRAEREYETGMAAYQRLQLENQQLREQARRLRDDPTAIEEAARRELGLIRPGETLVIVRPANQRQAP